LLRCGISRHTETLAAGAAKFDYRPNSDQCFVYADPTGHPFCLTAWDGDMAQR
jgi:hypothetical protein